MLALAFESLFINFTSIDSDSCIFLLSPKRFTANLPTIQLSVMMNGKVQYTVCNNKTGYFFLRLKRVKRVQFLSNLGGVNCQIKMVIKGNFERRLPKSSSNTF